MSLWRWRSRHKVWWGGGIYRNSKGVAPGGGSGLGGGRETPTTKKIGLVAVRLRYYALPVGPSVGWCYAFGSGAVDVSSQHASITCPPV